LIYLFLYHIFLPQSIDLPTSTSSPTAKEPISWAISLYPAIVHLGGEAAMRGVVDEMKRVCEQWP
jgi:hypothetical protein